MTRSWDRVGNLGKPEDTVFTLDRNRQEMRYSETKKYSKQCNVGYLYCGICFPSQQTEMRADRAEAKLRNAEAKLQALNSKASNVSKT